MPNRLGKVRQRGMALISALMVLVILGIIAGCFAIVMNRDSRQSRISSYQIICLNAAQAGIDYAVWLHKHNLSFYPAVDYSESIGGTANRLRINNASNNSFSAVYPAKGSIYDLPIAALANSGGTKYDPVSDRQNTYKNQGSSTKEWDTEYMFVNDLSFWSDPSGDYTEGTSYENFMHDSLFCVTFQIRESVEDKAGTKVLHIVSTGKLRYVPSGYNWLTKDNWTQFAETLSQGTGAGLSSKRLSELGFEEYASRTVSSDFTFSPTATTGSYPAVSTDGYNSSDLPVNRQHQMPERNKREWFR